MRRAVFGHEARTSRIRCPITVSCHPKGTDCRANGVISGSHCCLLLCRGWAGIPHHVVRPEPCAGSPTDVGLRTRDFPVRGGITWSHAVSRHLLSRLGPRTASPVLHLFVWFCRLISRKVYRHYTLHCPLDRVNRTSSEGEKRGTDRDKELEGDRLQK